MYFCLKFFAYLFICSKFLSGSSLKLKSLIFFYTSEFLGWQSFSDFVHFLIIFVDILNFYLKSYVQLIIFKLLFLNNVYNND